MGVASCGKTSVGEALATRLAIPFTEGDRLHPATNVAKMSAGVPLTDADRWPWLSLVGETGAVRFGAVIGSLFKRPSSIKDMWRLREQAAVAAGRLADFLDGIVVQLHRAKS